MTDTLPSESAYFAGEFLTADDYAEEQAYQVAMQRIGAVALNTWGVANGFGVKAAGSGQGVTVSAGVAIDSQGRLLILAADTDIGPPGAIGPAVLTLSFAEIAAAPGPGDAPYAIETAVLAWRPADQSFDASLHLVLGRTITGSPTGFTTGGRRYAGVMSGAVEFLNPTNSARPGITGWRGGGEMGLRINAPLTRLSTMPPQQTSTAAANATTAAPAASNDAVLSVIGGALGVGTMSPRAAFDVLGPNVSQTGPGPLTSFDVLVRGTDSTLAQVIHVGDVLMVTDRQGTARQSPVAQITPAGELITATPLNCEAAPFRFEQALLVSVRDGKGQPALSIDREGWVGLGVDEPMAQLHVGDGDLELAGPNRTVSFAGDGTLQSLDGKSRMVFVNEDPQLEFHQSGDIQWLTGVGAKPPPVGSALTAAGWLGIGTLTPQAPLDVVGYIWSKTGGFVFPDGSVQLTAEVSVPLGTVIDWWRGATDTQAPSNFQICDGSKVTDPASPFVGMTVPNLADCFIVGVTDPTQAGATSGDDEHTHNYKIPAHNHPTPHTHPSISNQETGTATHDQGMAGSPDNNAQSSHKHQFSATISAASEQNSGPNSDAGNTATTDQASLVPPYMGLLKLVRIT